MKKIIKIYKNWLEKQEKDFPFQPYIAKEAKHYFVIQFKNILNLYFSINDQNNAGIFICEGERFWDIILDCDLYPEKTEEGKFFCTACNDLLISKGEEEEFWNSEQELWEDHVFNAMMEWCDEHFKPDNVLACYGIPEKTGWGAEIIKVEEIEKYRKKGYDTFLPIINPYLEVE